VTPSTASELQTPGPPRGYVGIPWLEALRREVSLTPELHRYVTDRREGDWLLLPGDLPHGRALFLGNCLGVLPFLLAEQFREVVACDDDDARVRLAEHRRQAERVPNLHFTARASFESGSATGAGFDLVALAEEFPAGSPSRRLSDPTGLRQIREVLTPGAWLACWGRFAGAGGPGRTSGSPVARRLRVSAYRRSANFLQRAGFQLRELYWRIPDHRPYQYYVPLRERTVTAYYLRHAVPGNKFPGGLTRALAMAANRAGLLAHVVNNLLVLAQRP
jgi:hypothetical protein